MNQEDFETTEAMKIWGGGFAQSLAFACRVADGDNLARIKGAFPELWGNYSKMAAAQRAENGPKWYNFGKP